jgi:alanine racemase
VDAVAARGGGRVHVKLDTGMGRLGTRDAGLADALVARIGRPAGLMTHFATADDPDDAFLDEQLGLFLAWAQPHKARDPSLLLHAANSAATLREPRAHLDLVRCGVAIYGMDPFGVDPDEHDLRPALTLSSYVAAVKDVAPGQSAGYGRRFVAQRPTVTGTVPIGYADGVRRGLTNNAELLVGGRRVPLVGTVSMDNVTVELGPGTDVRVGDEVVLLGAQGRERVLAEEWARRLGTINYEVTCALTARVPRTSVGEGERP